MSPLTPLQQRAFSAWEYLSEGHTLSFAAVAVHVPRDKVRRAVRALARKGLLQYEHMSWHDEGPAGAGYSLTEAGEKAIREIDGRGGVT